MVSVASSIDQDPRYVSLEVAEQPAEGGESVDALNVTLMFVISFATFVVVAKDTLAGNHQGQAVLVWMIRSFQRFRKTDDFRLDEGNFINPPSSYSLIFTHVVDYANALEC